MNMNTNIAIGAIAVLFLAGAGYLLYKSTSDTKVVTTFDECAAAGYAVMESYPRQCRTPDGQYFVEQVATSTAPTGQAYTAPQCALAGCSNIICTEKDKASDIVTTCEYREEYACYKTERCEVQPNGKCGWTQTATLSACLQASFVESKG